MSELTKLLAAAGLVTAGFFSASFFGPPDQAGGRSPASGDWTPERLEPLDEAEPVPTDSHATWDTSVAPAGHFADAQTTGFDRPLGVTPPREHRAARASWPSEQQAGEAPAWDDVPAIRGNHPARDRRRAVSPGGSLDDPRLANLAPPALLEDDERGGMRPVDRFPSPPDPQDTGERRAMGAERAESQPPDQSAASEGPDLMAPQAWSMSTPLRSRSEPRPTPPEAAEWHVVSDGDSLAKIAQRYLGDASLAEQIYEMNRDVLDSPDLLPIGAELRIPAARGVSDRYRVYDANGTARGGFEPQRRLVPLPEVSQAVTSIPRARLQRPVSSHAADPTAPSVGQSWP